MSYVEKIENYQADCKVVLGKYKLFSEYIEKFSKNVSGVGLDLGAGPKGCNSNFFSHCILHGCDAEKTVVETLPDSYSDRFHFILGKDILPYENDSLDFVVCSCVIQHLNNLGELKHGLNQITRVLKQEGYFYLMFKVGVNDTQLTHFNKYYLEERTFRVFSSEHIISTCFMNIVSKEILLDDNWIPYCCLIFEKK